MVPFDLSATETTFTDDIEAEMVILSQFGMYKRKEPFWSCL